MTRGLPAGTNTTHLFREDFATKQKPGEGRVRPKHTHRVPKSKKIAAMRERTFQAELARIHAVDIPGLPKEKKIPEARLIKPKKQDKPKFLDQIKQALRPTPPAE